MTAHGIVIHGETNVAGLMAPQASLLYGRTVAALVGHLVKDGVLAFDPTDEIAAAACVTHAGELRVPIAA